MRSSLEYDELAAAGRHDDEIHHDQHQIVVPAVGSAAPEPRLPHEDLLLDRAEHDQDQPDRGELCEESERDADATGHFRAAQEYREAGARTDALRPLDRGLEVVPSALQDHARDTLHARTLLPESVGIFRTHKGPNGFQLISNPPLPSDPWHMAHEATLNT